MMQQTFTGPPSQKLKPAKKFSGVVVPMVTPFTADGKIDADGVHKLVNHLVGSGAHAFVGGTTGEAASIAKASKRLLVKEAIAAAAGRCTLYAGIGGNCLEEAIEEAKAYADAGADAVVATMACYYPVDADAVLRYFEAMAATVPLPLIIYNIPATTHLSLPIGVIDKLSHHPNIAGFKDSERGLERIDAATQLWKGREDFSYLIGWAVQSKYAMTLGADGLVPSSGNLVPAVYKAVLDASLNGDEEKAKAAQQKGDAVSLLYQKDRLLGQSLAAFKAMLSAYGLCEPHVLPPVYRLSTEEENFLKEHTLKTFGDLPTINSI